MRKKLLLAFLSVTPLSMGFSTGPPIKRTGAPADGGLNCTACHRTFAPANSDARGGVRIDVSNYAPGVRQTIQVTVAHPEGARWGFQLTARLASDETKPAGEFSSNSVVKVQCDDGSQLGAPGPCQPSQLQFTEHSDAPRTTTGAGFTFSVDWTPPAANVGDIVFYAAGNAADGSASNLGDRVYTTVRRISPPCTLTAKPSVTSAVNGASFGAAWNSGAVMSIFGSNFAPVGQKRPLTQGDIVGQRLPQSLGCIAVAVNGQNAPMIYVGPDQVNVQAPALAAIGPATLVVIANPGTSNELRSDPLNTSTQQALAPAFFTFDGKSVAATSADGSRIIANAALIAGSVAAQPGAIVVMYGTGLGATNPVVSPGDIVQAAASVVTPLTITVGGVPLSPSDILYAGLSPQSPSCLYQFNIRLPATLPDGDIPVLISAGGVQSPPGTTIPVRR